jgi:ElaA protein
MGTKSIRWVIKHFDNLSANELYDIITLRDLVFVVEQQCIYLDADGRDKLAFHLMGYDHHNNLLAYCRLFAPALVYDEASIGRVVTHPSVRRTGLGKQLMTEAIRQVRELFHTDEIRISGQLYLKKFYEAFGFEAFGEVYLEDDIEHIAMRTCANHSC